MGKQKLLYQHEKLLKFLYQAPLAIAEIDSKGDVLLADAVFVQLTAPLLQGKETLNLFDIFSPFLTEMQSRYLSFNAEHGVIEKDYLVKIPNSQGHGFLYYNFTFTRIDKESTMVAFSDKTEEVAKTERLTLVGEAMNEILHDLRNPLFVIQGALSASETLKVSMEERQEMNQLVASSTEEVMLYVENILDFSRGIALKKKEVGLEGLIQEIVRKLRIRYLKDPVQIVSEIIQPAKFICDPKEMERGIVNLVNNAYKALKERGNKYPKITIRLETSKEEVLVKVIDNGTPIPEDVKSTLLSYNQKESFGRRGLGFTIVKKIVKEHGGNIGITASLNKNVFVMRFPHNK